MTPWKSLCTAWNFTPSRRAVLSARSRKVPRRTKWKASSCSMVPSVTPRERCERYFTHSKNWPGSRPQAAPPPPRGDPPPAPLLRSPPPLGRAVLPPFEELARVALEGAAFELAVQLQPGLVLRLPDLGGERAAHRTGVLARAAQARQDGRGVVAVAHHEVQHAVARD